MLVNHAKGKVQTHFHRRCNVRRRQRTPGSRSAGDREHYTIEPFFAVLVRVFQKPATRFPWNKGGKWC